MGWRITLTLQFYIAAGLLCAAAGASFLIGTGVWLAYRLVLFLLS